MHYNWLFFLYFLFELFLYGFFLILNLVFFPLVLSSHFSDFLVILFNLLFESIKLYI